VGRRSGVAITISHTSCELKPNSPADLTTPASQDVDGCWSSIARTVAGRERTSIRSADRLIEWRDHGRPAKTPDTSLTASTICMVRQRALLFVCVRTGEGDDR
jgi:hypothetical protein